MTRKTKRTPRAGTKVRLILDELRARRTVTKLTAVHHDVGNVMECIRKLRNMGWDILTRSDVDGLGRRFTKYELAR